MARPLTKAQKDFLTKLIRVDQAGELGADLIYNGQHSVFKRTNKKLAPLIHHMWQQEVFHRQTFNRLQNDHRIRPSLLTPIWKACAFTLGASTALMGKEAAMACTEAVETVIGGHYNAQLRWLVENFPKDTDGMEEIKSMVKQFRDEELEHLDIAIENDSNQARPYWLLTETIKAGCRGAIFVAEKL
ncbi:ubiquinone biosynthesis protein COQ7 [Nadsonia fulvescens var. elongata DSM 6958]|uniref:5-demethoxyubiquinone hydroxylase, mitochondrial n=1 Tax=Nadsonia fulvescens var. elongata DSM 6958 TaxID=857566 RepID=A0A1E3PLB9_9ASCO|nr:ubiquinone biosynthesis protein COQ7 [Nadsonia fulvescens var. elongata DSM 6958]